MEIKNKVQHDPVIDLPIVEAYMTWALQAAEEVIGKQGLAIILRENGLERFIDHYPSTSLVLNKDISFGDYTNLCTGVMKFYGRAGKSVVIRIGRISSKFAVENQGAVFNVAARTAIKFLPSSSQIKTIFENLQGGFRKIYQDAGIENQLGQLGMEDRGDKWAYIAETCPLCAGKESDSHICWSWIGVLKESLMWFTGKEFEVEEVECRAMGAPACVWEVSKTAKE
jgi:predicted hydrocarbon binding protein